MNNGIIEIDSDAGKEIGFTSDRFYGYLWKTDDSIVISFIESHKRGNFRQLVEKILDLGLRVDIPTPLGRMEDIVNKNGYKFKLVDDEIMGMVEVWSLRLK